MAESQIKIPSHTGQPRVHVITVLRGELGNPLFRNAYALMINGGLTGVLGVAYWFLAARSYRPAQVGRESAQNQAMMFLGSLTALNFMLIRFIPEMGRRTGTLVRRSYLAVAVAALTTAVGFLLTLKWWGPSFGRLASPVAAMWFIVSVVGWALFTTQDGVLTGLRQATWVLGKNTTFAALKIVLLLALATALPDYGISVSWVVAALVLLLPIDAFIARKLIPLHASTPSNGRPIPSGGQIGRYLAGDYAGTLCYTAMINLVPVLVAAHLDPRTNAYFYVAWVLGASVDVLAVNMTMSLTVEGAFDADRLAVACRAVLRRMALIFVPIVIALLFGARIGLSIFGPGYAAHGASLLRLLALAMLPKAATEIYIGVLRVQRRTRLVALVQALRFAGVLALVHILTGREGIVGAGVAVLAVSLLVGAGVLPALLRTAKLSAPPAKLELGGAPPADPGLLRRLRGAWSRLSLAGVLALFCAGLTLFWVPLLGVRLGRMSDYGLISVLPIATFVGAGLLVIAFMLTLGLSRPHRLLLGVQVVAIVFALHGLAPALEPIARDPTAWQHVGFIEYITRNGTVDASLDARFSWPGFFALVGFLTRAAGIHNLDPIVHWTTVANHLLYLLPAYLILRVMRANWRAKWLSAWLFVVADWVGQDYFSPQAFGMLLYLVFVAVLLNWFRPALGPVAPVAPVALAAPSALRGRGRAFLIGPLSAGENPPVPPGLAERSVLLLLLIVLYAVTTASHQLTPYLMLLACTAFILARRCTVRGLPVLLAVITVVWVNFMTTAYWAKNLGDLFSGLGRLLANVALGTENRISNGSPELARVQETRILLAATIVMLALFGALRRRRRGIDDRVALILLCVPFLALGLQSYGGEITMRVYFFLVPGAAILIGYLFFPATDAPVRAWQSVCAAAVCGLILVGGFLFVRFGNEPSEQVRPGDVQALAATLRSTPTGTVNIVWLTDPTGTIGYFPQMPWGYRDMERFNYTAVAPARDPADISRIVRGLDQTRGRYFVTTRVHEAYLRGGSGISRSYISTMRDALASSPLLRPVFNDGEAVVYTMRKQPGAQAPPVPARRPFTIGRTPWTPVGLAIVPLLLIVLIGRELHALRLPLTDRRRLHGYTVWAVPMLLILAAVVIERFAVLG